MDENQPKNISINISSGTIIKTLGFILLLGALYYLSDIVLILLTSVVVAASVGPISKWIAGDKIPRAIAVLLVYLLFFVIFIGTVYFLVPPIFQELSSISSTLPTKINSIGGVSSSLDPLSSVTGGLAKSFTIQEMITELQTSVTNVTSGLFNVTRTLFDTSIGLILILVISFYLAVQENGVENFLRVIIPAKQEDYVIDLWHRSKNKIGKWLQGQIILSLIIGLLVYLGLTILRVKFALSLGILAALFEIIPFFGPILSAVPGVLVGFNESLPLGLMVLGLYIIIHQFENHLIYPLVIKKIIGVNPLVVIIALLVGTKLAGILGLILAVPLTTGVMELVSDIEKKKSVFRSSRKST